MHFSFLPLLIQSWSLPFILNSLKSLIIQRVILLLVFFFSFFILFCSFCFCQNLSYFLAKPNQNWLQDSSLICLLTSATALKCRSTSPVHSLHFFICWLYITLTAPIASSQLSADFASWLRMNLRALLLSVSLVITQIVVDRHDMAACARGPFVGQWFRNLKVENIHPVRGTQIGHNTERHSLLTVFLWAAEQGQTGLYIRCQTYKQHQSLSKGSREVKWVEQNLNYAAAVSIEINVLGKKKTWNFKISQQLILMGI